MRLSIIELFKISELLFTLASILKTVLLLDEYSFIAKDSSHTSKATFVLPVVYNNKGGIFNHLDCFICI